MFEHAQTRHEYDMKAHIFEATADLLRAYTFEELRVGDICRIADISKPTFYRYFSDKYEIAEWALMSYMRPPMLAMVGSATWEEMFLVSAKQVKRYRNFYARVFAKPSGEVFLNLNSRMIAEACEKVIYERNNVERSDRLDFQIRYVAAMVPAMAERWFAEGLRLTDEEFARFLASAVPHDLRLLLDSFADTK